MCSLVDGSQPIPIYLQQISYYLAQRDAAAYVALAEETELTAKDCHALGTLLSSGRKHAEALAWVERGIAIAESEKRASLAGYDLARLRRDLLVRLGRGDEALQAAWAEYQEAPSKYAYADLMKFVPKAERTAWHERALDAARDADLHSQIELFLETRELARLVEILHRSQDESLEALSHFATEPAAQGLEETRPEIAARLWRAQGMRGSTPSTPRRVKTSEIWKARGLVSSPAPTPRSASRASLIDWPRSAASAPSSNQPRR